MRCSLVLPFWLLVAGLLFAACNVIPPAQDDPTRYFVLTGPALTEERISAPTGTLSIGVKAVRIPEYLRNREIAVRRGSNELAYQNYARWAEPLEVGIARVVRAQLAVQPAVARVHVFPFPFEERRDYDVTVSVIHCEGLREENGRNVARFSAMLEITTAGEEAQVVARKLFVAPEQEWNGNDFGALANRLSEAVAALSQEILETLPKGN